MIILETESDAVLHRRRSKLSNVLCFLNTLNLPSPCSAQDDGFPNMKVSLSVSLGHSMKVSREQTSCVLGKCRWMPTALDWTVESLTQSRPPHGEHWRSPADSKSWNQSHERPHCKSERKLELNKPLGMNVSELSTPVVLCFTHRPRLWETQYYLLNTDTHFLYVFLPPPKTTVSFYEHTNLQIRWAKDIIRLD